MTDSVFSATHLSKRFDKHAGVSTILSRLPFGKRRNDGIFWALRDVSFNVQRGECVGVIGHNGAGKSTLLKILSRVTTPTEGTFAVTGRVSTLIDVGAGFHPDFTGRENVFLNAAIIGMGRRDIESRFDAIVDFADLWDFIDVPVKRYSSGMYVRLGFSVAIHTDPAALLVDEVLSVGDLGFEQKCLERISRLREGQTSILLVSHNMHLVNTICDRVLVLDHGQVIFEGEPSTAVELYRERTSTDASNRTTSSGRVAITSVRTHRAGDPCPQIDSGQPLSVRVTFNAHEVITDPILNVALYSESRVQCTGCRTSADGIAVSHIEAGTGFFDVHFDSLNLQPGLYSASALIFESNGLNQLARSDHGATFIVRGDRKTNGIARFVHCWEAGAGVSLTEGATER